MKKNPLFLFLLLSLFWAGLACPRLSFSQTSANLDVNASFPDCVDLSWWNIHKLSSAATDPWGGVADQSAMDFGTLASSTDHPDRLFSDTWFCVFLMTNVDEPYHIKQTSTSLMTTDGQHNLDRNFIVVPDYSADDKWEGQWPQGALVNGEQVGSPSLVKNADILFTGVNNHILRLYYSIPALPKVAVTGWEPILTSQLGKKYAVAKYEGTVTITITPQGP